MIAGKAYGTNYGIFNVSNHKLIKIEIMYYRPYPKVSVKIIGYPFD